MKNARVFWLVLFMLALTLSAQAEGRRGMQVVPKSQRYALLIGINEYNKPFTPLKYCDADMKALEKVLLQLDFPQENIVRLSSSARDASHLPTKANILYHARLLAEEVDKNGIFIVAFSGHGASFGDESYFCPMDTVNKDISSLVKRSDVYGIVEKCPAKQKLVFVDACRNSLVMEGWKSSGGMKSLVDPVGIENPGFFIISSCKTGQFSWEDKKLGHGVFTHFLIEGLRGKAAQDGQISVHGLFSYVNFQTKRYVRLNFGESQIPLLRGDEDELDDFLIAKIEKPLPTSSGMPFPSTSRKAGERKVLKSDGIEYAFRWCPPGEFMMGKKSTSRSDQKPHKVKLTHGFWLLETEVTQAMWQSVMGENPSKFKGEMRPVERVSWYESREFCQKLSKKLGQTVKLPTEAQWEYACQAFTAGDLLVDVAWCYESVFGGTHEVGQKKPNDWGLYDMQGNVMEWCSDWYYRDYYYDSPTKDPENTTPSSDRVHRGGGWCSEPIYCRSTTRNFSSPHLHSDSVGLRILLVPSPEE